MLGRILCASLLLAGAVGAELPLPEIPLTNVAPRLVVPEPERGPAAANVSDEVLPMPAASPARVASRPQTVLAPMTGPLLEQGLLATTNNEQFAGRLVKLEGGIVHWQSPLTRNTLQLRLAAFHHLRLPAVTGTNRPPARWLVRLHDGSWLRCTSLRLQDQQFSIELPTLGKRNLPRDQVARLWRVEPGRNELVAFQDAPVYCDGDANQALRPSSRYAYQPVALPEHMLLEWEWPRYEHLGANLRLVVPRPEDLLRSRLQISLVQHRLGASLQVSDDHLHNRIGLAGPLTNTTGRSSWVALSYHRKTGDAVFYVDGKQTSHGQLAWPGVTAAVGLVSQLDQSGTPSPRALLVSSLPETASLPELSPDKDSVWLANWDAIYGRLEAITTDAVRFSGPMGPLELPFERVTRLHLAGSQAGGPKAGEGLWQLAGGEQLRGLVQQIDAQSVRLQSHALGEVVLARHLVVGADLAPERPAMDMAAYFPNQEQQAGGLFGRLALIKQIRQARHQRWGLAGGLQSTKPGQVHLKRPMSLEGDWAGIGDGLLHWRHPAALEPLQIPLEQVQRFTPLPRPGRVAALEPRTIVRLRNGNVLTGVVGVTDAERLSLTTAYAAGLSIPRQAVAALHAWPRAPHPLDQGPSQAWTDMFGEPVPLRDGLFWLTQYDRSCRRELPLPEKLRIDIEMTWSPGPFALSVRVFAKQDEQQQPVSHWGVDLHANGASFHVYDQGSSNRQATVFVPATQVLTNLDGRGQGTLTVLADRPNHQMRLYLDGHAVGEWKVPAGFASTGQGIQVHSSIPSGAVRQILLSGGGDPLPAATAPLPPIPAVTRSPDEATVVLQNGDCLSLDQLHSDGQTLSGHHQSLGRINIAAAAVRQIEWPVPPRNGAPTAKTAAAAQPPPKAR